MNSRRSFIGTVASGLATTLASPTQVLGAGERIRLGIVGAGERGMQLVREAAALPGVELAAFADVYSRRLEDANKVVPGAASYSDYRRLLDDQTIDAVVIATPQHLHCEHFVAALDAGKHVYQEKTMAFTVEHAKRMRAAYQNTAGKQVVQIGHQACSSGHVPDAAAFTADGKVGKITALRMHMYRNTPHGKPQWARPVYPDVTPENVLWSSFQGEGAKYPFDPNRFVNWRYFWEYSGGNFYENMCHQVAFWYKVLDLQIPTRVMASGGVYLWKDGREVPDTMNVSMIQPEEMLVTWDSGFGNNALGVTEEVLGANGTISRGQQIRYAPQKVNRPDATELVGQSRSVPASHMRNFLDSIRGDATPACPFELGYRVSIACRMAVDSYREGRAVAWDSENEQIV